MAGYGYLQSLGQAGQRVRLSSETGNQDWCAPFSKNSTG